MEVTGCEGGCGEVGWGGCVFEVVGEWLSEFWTWAHVVYGLKLMLSMRKVLNLTKKWTDLEILIKTCKKVFDQY